MLKLLLIYFYTDDRMNSSQKIVFITLYKCKTKKKKTVSLNMKGENRCLK